MDATGPPLAALVRRPHPAHASLWPLEWSSALREIDHSGRTTVFPATGPEHRPGTADLVRWSRRTGFAPGLAVGGNILSRRPGHQESPDARGHGHLDLLHVISKVDPGRKQHPRPLTHRVERAEVVLELAIGVDAHRAGKLGLVDIAEPAQEAGRLDGRASFSLQEAGALLLFAAEGERIGFQKQQDIILLALFVNVLDKLKLMLGRTGLGRFNWTRSFTASAPMSLIFRTLQPGSTDARGEPTLFFGQPDIS